MVFKKFFLKNRSDGFSLTELLIVMTIVGLLSVWLLTNIKPWAMIGRGKDARRKSDLKKIQIAVEDYYSDHDCYPISLPACGEQFLPYLDRIPCDPDGGDYYYSPDANVCPRHYRIYASLNFIYDPEIAKVGCETGCGPGGVGTYNFGVSSSNVALEIGSGMTPTLASATGAPTIISVPTSVPTGESSREYWACVNYKCDPIPGPICINTFYDRNDCYGTDCALESNQCIFE